jgi:hypothetical protein
MRLDLGKSPAFDVPSAKPLLETKSDYPSEIKPHQYANSNNRTSTIPHEKTNTIPNRADQGRTPARIVGRSDDGSPYCFR